MMPAEKSEIHLHQVLLEVVILRPAHFLPRMSSTSRPTLNPNPLKTTGYAGYKMKQAMVNMWRITWKICRTMMKKRGVICENSKEM